MKKIDTSDSRSIHIGTAGWTIPTHHKHHFPEHGTHLERSAQRFNCVEINSSFHQSHQRRTWERWASCTPPMFRFSVKLPKSVTHSAKLHRCGAALQQFFDEVRSLGDKLGPVLVQLPPSLEFEEAVVSEFLTTMRELHPQESDSGFIVVEPRHPSWFTAPAERLLRSFEIGRVASDPAKGFPLAATPGGWNGVCYWRLHGTPRTYYSAYDSAFLSRLAQQVSASACAERWVIFDNTALGHAAGNAFELQQVMQHAHSFK